MVIDRALEIPKSQVVLYYHHCLKHAYRYLQYSRL